jgi:hypothetical protein
MMKIVADSLYQRLLIVEKDVYAAGVIAEQCF